MLLAAWIYTSSLHKAIHHLKMSILSFPNQNSTSTIRCSPEGQLCFVEDPSPVSSYEHRLILQLLISNILNGFQEHRKHDVWNQIHAFGLFSCSTRLQTDQKQMENISMIPVFLSFSPTASLIFWHLSSRWALDPLSEDSSKWCRTKVTGSRNCISQLLRVYWRQSRLWISCLLWNNLIICFPW